VDVEEGEPEMCSSAPSFSVIGIVTPVSLLAEKPPKYCTNQPSPIRAKFGLQELTHGIGLLFI